MAGMQECFKSTSTSALLTTDTCNWYGLLVGFEYRLILSMFYVWFRVSFDTQYILFIVSRYCLILDMFYVTFQGCRFGSPYGYCLQGSG